MKNTVKHKLLSLLMALTLLCLPCLLAACGQGGSNESTQSAESIPQPTHAELFWEALVTLGEYFDPLEATFGMPLFSIITDEEDGTETSSLTIEKINAMGVSMIGDQPVKKETVSKNMGGIVSTAGTWFAAGDEIKFEEYSDETMQYVLLPGVKEEPFTAVSNSLLTVLTESQTMAIPGGVLENLESSVKALFTDEMILIAKSEAVDTYTITMDAKTAKEFDTVLDNAMEESGLSDLFGTADLMNDEGIEVSGGKEKTMVLVLNVAAGKNYQLKLSVLEDGVEVGLTRFSIAVNGAVTTLTYAVTEGDAVLSQTTCTFTVAANNLKIEAEIQAETTTTADFTVTADENKKLTYKGTINASTVVEEMTLSIPITINGTYRDTEAGVETTLSLSASIANLLEISMLTESVFVPGSVEIATPAPGIDVKEIKMDALITEMETAYPNAAELYRSLMGLADPETGLIPRG